jgi:nitrogen regulatory protein PII
MNTLLVLNISPELEEDLVDYLLQTKGVSGFTTQTVHGHGPEGAMSLAEQVAGRRKRLRIEILMQEKDVATLLAGLGGAVGRDIVYWQQPVSGYGRVG